MPRGLDLLTGSLTEFAGHSQVSPRFAGDRKTQRSERVWDVPWTTTNVEDHAKAVLGYPTRMTDGGGPYLSRYLPAQDPYHPRRIGTSYTSIGVGKPRLDGGDAGATNAYDTLRISVTYESPSYNVIEDDDLADEDDGSARGSWPSFPRFADYGPRWSQEIDRYVSHFENPQGSFITPPATGAIFGWASYNPVSGLFTAQPGLNAGYPNQGYPTVSIPDQVSKIVADANLTLRWHEIPEDALPLATIYESLGRVNAVPFGSYANTLLQFDQWTMLFVGAILERHILANDTFGWTIDYLFKFNPNKWNYLLNPRAVPSAFYQVSLMSPINAGNPGTKIAIFYDPSTYLTNSAADAPTPDNVEGKLLYNLANLNYLFEVL